MKATLKPGNKFIPFSDAVADGQMDHFLREPESVLDDRASPTFAGVLRPGIKVPKNDGQDRLTSQELETYHRMMKVHLSPREIEKVIGKELRPENVGYFSVYGSECRAEPEHASMIRKLYGNERGEIHRLRITFVDSEWWEIFPHKLMAFRESGLYCSSEPRDGQLIATRDISKDGVQESGPSRPFRRKLKEFPCIPDDCPIYQKGHCKLSGLLHFLILGVPGTDVWRLPTSSWNSVRGIVTKIKRFKNALSQSGRELIGIPFWLYKYKASVSVWDASRGRRRRVEQWLFAVEAPDFPLSDLLVKQAGFSVSQSLQLPMLTNPTAESRDSKCVPPKKDENEEEAKNPNPAGLEAKHIVPEDPAVSSESVTRPSQPAEPVKTMLPSFPAAEPYAPMISQEEVMAHLREKIQNEVEPKGSVPLEVITLSAERFHKQRLSDLTLTELQKLDGAIEEFKCSSWAHCKRCESLVHPEVKSDSLRHYQEIFCRNCQSKETPRASALPPKLTVVKKPAGQIQGAGF